MRLKATFPLPSSHWSHYTDMVLKVKLGVLPRMNLGTLGVQPKINKSIYISTILVKKFSGITSRYLSGSKKVITLGVLPENPYLFFGSNISHLYILSISLPV